MKGGLAGMGSGRHSSRYLPCLNQADARSVIVQVESELCLFGPKNEGADRPILPRNRSRHPVRLRLLPFVPTHAVVAANGTLVQRTISAVASQLRTCSASLPAKSRGGNLLDLSG